MDAELIGDFNETESLAGDENLAAVTLDVFLTNEAFNRGCSGGGSPQASLRHGLAKFFIINELACTFHSGKEGSFIKACWGFGLFMLDLNISDLGGFSLGDGTKFVFARSNAWLAPIDGEPAWCDEDLAGGQEGIGGIWVSDAGDAAGIKKLGGWIKHREKTLGHQFKNFSSGFIKFDKTTGGNNRKVV